MKKATRDPLIVEALAARYLAPDYATGTIYRWGKPVGRHNRHGYIYVPLPGGKTALAHRVVWIAAHGPISDGLMVNHRNRVRHDNRLENLELVTAAQNLAHSLGNAYYDRVRPEDEEAVDPAWLALVRSLAANGNVTREQIRLLRGQPLDEEPSVYSPYGKRPERCFTGTRRGADANLHWRTRPSV